MKATIYNSEDLVCRIRVDVPSASIDERVDSRLRDIQKQQKIKGFRQGKVPRRVLMERFGADARAEAIDTAVQQAAHDAMAAESIEPAGPIKVTEDDARSEDEFSFVAECEVLPAIEVAGTDSLSVERPSVEIGDSEVDELILRLRQQLSRWLPADRPAQLDDRLIVDVTGSVGGKPVSALKRRAATFLLDDGQVDALTREHLVGASVGSKIECDIEYPVDHHDPQIAGNTVAFSVVLRQVTERVLPDVDSKFFAQIGIVSCDVEEFRAAAKQDLVREAEVQVRAVVKMRLLDQLKLANPLDLPSLLVAQEAESLQQKWLQREAVANSGSVPPVEKFSDLAKRNVHMGLLIRSIFRANGMEVLRSETNEKILESCRPDEDQDAKLDSYYKNPEMLRQIENEIVDEKVINWLLRRATIVDNAMSFLALLELRAASEIPPVDVLFGRPLT